MTGDITMKKIVVFSIALYIVFFVCGIPAAAYKAVGVDVSVDIINGGTVEVIAEVNCPLPDKSNITLNDGERDTFHLEFLAVGEYSYTVKTVPDERNIKYDDTIYNVRCYVEEKNGMLSVTTVIYNLTTGYKYSSPDGDDKIGVKFENISKDSDSPGGSDDSDRPHKPDSSTPTSSIPVSSTPTTSPPAASGTSSSVGVSRPKTGDDSRLDMYLLICILASAGLFGLSVMYLRDTNRLINQ